jgi:hypothetical protein
VDSGRYRWVFNVATNRSETPVRELRFWVDEVIAPEPVSHLQLDDVITRILPEKRSRFRGAEIAQMLLVSPQTMARHMDQMGGVAEVNTTWIAREAFTRWLRSRWIGGQP